MSENKVTYGLENVHYAPITLNSETNKITYGTPKRIPGAVELSLEKKGDMVEFPADNITYFAKDNNLGYDGTAIFAKLPDDFLIEILGEKIQDGVQVELADSANKQFALLFQFEGDKHKNLYVLYYCSASRPSVASKTNSTGEPNTQELKFVSSPRPGDKLVKARTNSETPADILENWFMSVFEPGGAE